MAKPSTINGDCRADSSLVSADSQRIREVFTNRKERGGPFDLFGFYNLQERQEYLLRFFRSVGLASLGGLSILDIGCGSGGMLRRFIEFGAQPENCFGIDLFQKSLSHGRHLSPNVSFVEGNAAQLPFPSARFDLVSQFTVLTSVLEPAIRKSIAVEIVRTMRPGAYFIWYDFLYSNPSNPSVRGIGRGEIKDLFPGCHLSFHKVTLAPPIGRRIASASPALYRFLRSIPLLRTHYFCFIRKH